MPIIIASRLYSRQGDFRLRRRVAEVLVAVIACEVEIGEPDITIAAAGGDEGDVASIGCPGGGMIGGGVLGERDGFARSHVDDGNFEVVVEIGFEGEPLPIW
jgi:hypothetical protein